MEKPDAEGYVHVRWPSRNVPHGGIFHTRIAKPTEDQRQFLKVLLEESKLNMKIRHDKSYDLRCEDDFRRKPISEALDIRTMSAARPRPRTSRRRSLSAIRSSGILDIDTYQPMKRGEDRERMKDRLANTMQYGDSPDQPQQVALPVKEKKPKPKLPTNKEKWNDLVTQIRERAEWLAEMEWLGEAAAAPHREIVQGQIAERMRALDALGLDSVPSTARSTLSSQRASPTGPRAAPEKAASAASKRASAKSPGTFVPTAVRDSVRTTHRSSVCSKNETKKKVLQNVFGKWTAEENVEAYKQYTPLAYSPRRRV